ncbi:hypothetical protein F7R13_24630 [Burkholderia territorii]|uniref:Uncharacterized protein n=1 Tax=Burkholderia territorii TaxID=1503055 RepID=A0A6L3ND05_9BURK|nr:hypothetical protein F7R13_24630 [Burkholderia territorii]TXG18139.1 hypothetical protein FU139_12665 [Burkholderia territorii]
MRRGNLGEWDGGHGRRLQLYRRLSRRLYRYCAGGDDYSSLEWRSCGCRRGLVARGAAPPGRDRGPGTGRLRNRPAHRPPTMTLSLSDRRSCQPAP